MVSSTGKKKYRKGKPRKKDETEMESKDTYLLGKK